MKIINIKIIILVIKYNTKIKGNKQLFFRNFQKNQKTMRFNYSEKRKPQFMIQ